ncbi:hypothetical protein GCM10027024_32090 [Microbacterium insulae]
MENDPVTGQPLMLRTSTGAVSLYVYDGTGNPTAILRDVTGTGYVYTYDPYGLATLSYTSGGSGTGQNPFLFKGGIQDRATGWVHYGNRWYNPTTGRWTQQDTLDAPIDPQNANRYAYAGCDPINNIDPTGQLTYCQQLNSAAAFFGVVAAGATAYAVYTSPGNAVPVAGQVNTGGAVVIAALTGLAGAFFFAQGVLAGC